MRELHAFINERRVGVLAEESDIWTWTYDAEWAQDPLTFDLSPKLPRNAGRIVDGSTERHVQWYFDNLLPEEGLRTVYSREAKVPAGDAFGLLAYFGAESAGSLVLLRPNEPNPAEKGRSPLPDEVLSQRIRNLPRVPLMHDAPKRMSVAGAQHKLLVILDGDALYEPLPGDSSTHILKPDHPEAHYPHTVVNEYFSMVLAHEVGLDVPRVVRRYVPEPVYIIERFDRVRDGGDVRRRHMIDTCQLLGKARTFKYTAASVESLSEVANACRAPAAAKLTLYRWLIFNLLIGNGDNHLKNISALVGSEGIQLAPAYDLVATAAYATKAFSEQPSWPGLELALPLPKASHFGDVTKKSVLDAADAIGVPSAVAQRELVRLTQRTLENGPRVLAAIEQENAGMSEPAKPYFAGEVRMLRTITSIVIADMARQLS
jgi:serine/threonine-protein kinase HipA